MYAKFKVTTTQLDIIIHDVKSSSGPFLGISSGLLCCVRLLRPASPLLQILATGLHYDAHIYEFSNVFFQL